MSPHSTPHDRKLGRHALRGQLPTDQRLPEEEGDLSGGLAHVYEESLIPQRPHDPAQNCTGPSQQGTPLLPLRRGNGSDSPVSRTRVESLESGSTFSIPVPLAEQILEAPPR